MSEILVRDLEIPVRVITLNRPRFRNALNSEMIESLHEALKDFEQSPQRVLAILAHGDHFCAGGDLNDLPARFWKCLPGMGVPVSKPVVCGVKGWTVGLGFTLSMMSDMVIAGEGTRFCFPEAKVGLFAGIGAALAGRIPQKVAVEFLMMGNPMSASRAYDVGMANRVVPDSAVEDATLETAAHLAALSPKVVAAVKRWTSMTTPKSPAESFSVESALVADMMASDDLKEGLTAFNEKRTARFTGN
ncbi:MAG: enoyl-CoA hydratase/isomerase family protein [Comamonadaceae bacterium]|nr:enoyl-CoA hydratase/isomerase family protein [Comamonadaceae bacterium]